MSASELAAAIGKAPGFLFDGKERMALAQHLTAAGYVKADMLEYAFEDEHGGLWTNRTDCEANKHTCSCSQVQRFVTAWEQS